MEPGHSTRVATSTPSHVRQVPDAVTNSFSPVFSFSYFNYKTNKVIINHPSSLLGCRTRPGRTNMLFPARSEQAGVEADSIMESLTDTDSVKGLGETTDFLNMVRETDPLEPMSSARTGRRVSYSVFS